jgi:hypothetical protein
MYRTIILAIKCTGVFYLSVKETEVIGIDNCMCIHSVYITNETIHTLNSVVYAAEKNANVSHASINPCDVELLITSIESALSNNMVEFSVVKYTTDQINDSKNRVFIDPRVHQSIVCYGDFVEVREFTTI